MKTNSCVEQECLNSGINTNNLTLLWVLAFTLPIEIYFSKTHIRSSMKKTTKLYSIPAILGMIIISVAAHSQNYMEIGTGTTQNTMPVYSSWNYSWSSLIYNHNDLGASKTITAIGLDCINGPKTVTNQKIYARLTTADIFSSAAYEDPLNNGYTLVYEGDLTFQSGWNEIQLTTPIVYDGVQNIVFHWENRWGSTYGPVFNSTLSSVNNNKNCGSDAGFPGAGSSGYLNPYPGSLTNTRFYYQSAGPATPNNPFPTDNAGRVSVDTDLQWILGANTTSCDLYFGTDPANLALIGNNLPAQQGINIFLIDGLLADSTMHYWKVIAKNGNQQESSPVWSFKTEVVIDEFPYFQGFEDSTVFNSWPVESAWVTIPEYSWYEMDTLFFSGNLCAKSFFLNSNLQAILQSPKVLLPHNCLIRYQWANMDPMRVAGYDTTYFEVSTNGGQTWSTLDYLSPQSPTDYIERTHSLDAYAGNNFFFRFRYRTTNNSNSHSVFLDDIRIEEGTVGIPETTSGDDFAVFPNPSQGRFTVQLNQKPVLPVTVTIYDPLGKTVLKKEISTSCEEIDASTLGAGVYILNLGSGNLKYQQKLIIR